MRDPFSPVAIAACLVVIAGLVVGVSLGWF
jgi:hypothetical protein